MKRCTPVIILLLSVAPLFGDGPPVNHTMRVDREGTRSESRHGYLVIGEQALPDFFWTVIAAGKQYSFHQRKNLWGDDGYFPAADLKLIEQNPEKISSGDLKDGFTVGEKRKAGTPADWIYLEWTGGAGFASPTGVVPLIEALALKPIPRFLRMELMKD
jgi:hypothetical protein